MQSLHCRGREKKRNESKTNKQTIQNNPSNAKQKPKHPTIRGLDPADSSNSGRSAIRVKAPPGGFSTGLW